MKTGNEVPLNLIRNLALLKQGLFKRASGTDTKNKILKTIDEIGLVQLDGISVVDRSHYLVLFSRLGPYDKRKFDELHWPDGKLLELWTHAASLLPTSHYRYIRPLLVERLKQPLHERHVKKLGKPGTQLLDSVLRKIERSGDVSCRDFETPPSRKRKWWNRKPHRIALEILYRRGDIAVKYRRNFERHYDLFGKVVSESHKTAARTYADWLRWSTLKSIGCQGAATIEQIADYYRQPVKDVADTVSSLEAEEQIVPIKIERWPQLAYICRDDLKLIYSDIRISNVLSDVTTFLSPFDNLLWHRDRVKDLFDFSYRNEMYTPAGRRKYGYYVMPILYKGRLAGRIDPKADRQNQSLVIRDMTLEKPLQVDDEFLSRMASALIDFMSFHGCRNIDMNTVKPARLRDALTRAIRK